MIRIIALMVLVVAALGSSTAANAQAAAWKTWLAQNEPALEAKREGIRFAIDYQKQVCPLQADERKKTDCDSRLEKIIGRRKTEAMILAAMFDAVKKLPNGETAAMVPIVNAAFNQMNAETSQMLTDVIQMYPRQQAAAEPK